jgi:hypothetical protein
MVQVRGFSKDHPPFSERFPYDEPTSVAFDHATHLNRYFKDPTFSARVPQSCLACHALEPARQRLVTTMGFEQSCATCHAAEIGHHDLVLFRLPALTSPIDPAIVQAACGMAVAEPGPKPAEPISEEDPTVISAFLLGVDTKDPDGYTEPMKALITAMAQEGVTPLAKALEERAGSAASIELLAGLSPETVKQAACAWAANQEYEPPEDTARSGWYADALSLRYAPGSHADPIARRWIELSLNAPTAAGDAHAQRHAETLRKGVLARARGVGFCLKCHVVATQDAPASAERLPAHWTSRGRQERPYTQFSHGVHVKHLGGEGQSCAACHVVNRETTHGAAWTGGFQPIAKARCAECHGAQRGQALASSVRQDCLLCHTYHVGPGPDQPGTTALTRHGQPGIELSQR